MGHNGTKTLVLFDWWWLEGAGLERGINRSTALWIDSIIFRMGRHIFPSDAEEEWGTTHGPNKASGHGARFGRGVSYGACSTDTSRSPFPTDAQQEAEEEEKAPACLLHSIRIDSVDRLTNRYHLITITG